MLEVLAHRSFLCSRYSLAFFALFAHVVAGQTYINGQTFTDGLAVVDSPSPLNPGHAGSPISIAVDVSGDGHLQPAASIPGSSLPTRYDLLEIYLVSDETNLNMTVSAGPGFLTGETGSVRHLNFPIPSCIPAGNYNLTFYESSHFLNESVFTITPIPIPISNPSPSGNCSNLNPLQPQPQPSNPLPQSPFAPGSSVSASGSSVSAPGSSLSATALSSGMVTVITSSPNADAETLTLTLSNGVLQLPTITVTAQPTLTTVVLISMATVTETDQGSVTTFTQQSTLTTVIATPSPSAGGQTSDSDTSGFIPVNAGSPPLSSTPLSLIFGAWICVFLLY